MGATEELTSLPNFRDLGGHRTAAGTVTASGRVFRSVDLSRLRDDDAAELVDRGIGTVYDLRTADECGQRPDRVPEGMRRVALDVLADAGGHAAAQLGDVLKDPHKVEEILGGGRAGDEMRRTYRSLVSLPSARRSYRRLFLALAGGEGKGDSDGAGAGASLFHCTTGKDRTGWAAASLLTLLGVDTDDVTADYLRTNTDLLPSLQPVMDRFAASGGDPEVLRAVLGVDESYLQAAFTEVEAQYGGIRGYVTAGLGLADEDIDRLTAALTETPA